MGGTSTGKALIARLNKKGNEPTVGEVNAYLDRAGSIIAGQSQDPDTRLRTVENVSLLQRLFGREVVTSEQVRNAREQRRALAEERGGVGQQELEGGWANSLAEMFRRK